MLASSPAGPDGAGKTNFAGEYLPDDVRALSFVNADLIGACPMTGVMGDEHDRGHFREGRRHRKLSAIRTLHQEKP